MPDQLPSLLEEIRACTLCAAHLEAGPRPIVFATAAAPILIAGQAPGRRVHASGIPWDDPSGERLRLWLGIDADTFYDASKIALVPMGFCYPGTGSSGDLPPRPECRQTWHPRLMPLLQGVRLRIIIGQYAQAYHLPQHGKASVTDLVAQWRTTAPDTFMLPHPSPRNQGWFKRNPWFEAELLPALRQQVQAALADAKTG